MRKLIPLIFLFILGAAQSFANPNEVDCLNEAAIVAKVESFTNSGYLNCEFQCFLDMKYSDFEVKPTIYFQVGTLEDPTAFMSATLNEAYLKTLKIEQVFNENNYKLKINFGKIKVKGDFKARLVIIENGMEKIIYLKPSSFKDDITKMNTHEDSGLCKAEQFLKKIDFDNLYNNLSSL